MTEANAKLMLPVNRIRAKMKEHAVPCPTTPPSISARAKQVLKEQTARQIWPTAPRNARTTASAVWSPASPLAPALRTGKVPPAKTMSTSAWLIATWDPAPRPTRKCAKIRRARLRANAKLDTVDQNARFWTFVRRILV